MPDHRTDSRAQSLYQAVTGGRCWRDTNDETLRAVRHAVDALATELPSAPLRKRTMPNCDAEAADRYVRAIQEAS